MGGDVGGVERVGHRDRSGGGGAKIRERCCWLHPADSEGQPREGWGGRWGWGRSALGEELGEEGGTGCHAVQQQPFRLRSTSPPHVARSGNAAPTGRRRLWALTVGCRACTRLQLRRNRWTP